MGRNARLREHVTTVNFECRGVAALLHHPFRPLLVGVDERGTVRVYNHRHSTFVNAFHLASERPTSVVGLWQLNEAQARPLRHFCLLRTFNVWPCPPILNFCSCSTCALHDFREILAPLMCTAAHQLSMSAPAIS